MGFEITCKKAVDYISKREEQKLSLWQRLQLWRHLAICSLCRRFAHQNETMAAMFNSHDHHRHLTEDDKKKITDAVLGKRG